MFNACSAVILWYDFGVFSKEFFEQAQVFVINIVDLISGEVTFTIFISWHGCKILGTRTCCRRDQTLVRQCLIAAFRHDTRLRRCVCRA